MLPPSNFDSVTVAGPERLADARMTQAWETLVKLNVSFADELGSEKAGGRLMVVRKACAVALAAMIVVSMGAGLGMAAFPKRVAAATSVNGLDLSLMSMNAARQRLEAWWQERSTSPIELIGPSIDAEPIEATPAELGIRLDVEATLAQLPLDTFEEWVGRASRSERMARADFDLVLDFSGLDADALHAIVAQTSPRLEQASAVLDDQGTIVLTPEVASMELVLPAAIEQLERAVLRGQPALVQAMYSGKRVPDGELAKITEVVSTFSTWFSVKSENRCENIRVAAEKLDGVVLMPGETFSFNDFVGERSPENGFFKAGVYRKGRHEIGYGGGVCQVSTTLFNAAVLANMTVEKRGNHTFKVPYVPLGRDAAVSYGRLDMVFVNTTGSPVAISAKWLPGKITFAILGRTDPGVEVKIFQTMTATWDHEPVYVDDPTLEPGTEREIEKGGKGYKAVTTKVVYKDGVEISRETLCESHYPGAPKIIARNERQPRDPFGPIGPLSEKAVVPDIRSRPSH